MITLYRIDRKSHKTLFTWQSSKDELEPLGEILNVAPRPSKLDDLFEGGYFAYISGPRRAQTEAEALRYFQSHFSPPVVELTVFQGDRLIDTVELTSDICGIVTTQICEHFKATGVWVVEGGFGHCVFSTRDENRRSLGQINLRRGVTFRVEISCSNHLLILTDVIHRVEKDGRFLNERELRLQSDLDFNELFLLRKEFSTLDTDQVFRLCKVFAASLPNAVKTQFGLQPMPCSATQLSYDTWIWSHELSLELEVGNAQRVTLAQSVSKDPDLQVGLHTPPLSNLVVFLLHPSTILAPEFSPSTWNYSLNLLKEDLAVMLPNQEAIVAEICYSDLATLDSITGSIDAIKREFPGTTSLFLLVAPPETISGTHFPRDSRIRDFTKRLSRYLRKGNRGSYTVTLDWTNFYKSNDHRWSLENALLKGITVLGATPWRTLGIPMPDGLNEEEVCFIGVDLNIYRPVPVVGGVIFDGYGTAKGFHLVAIEKGCGDHVNTRKFASLIGNLLNHYTRVMKHPPRHVVIHRDGKTDDSDIEAASLLYDLGLTVDLVEVRKSGAPRLHQLGNVVGTPSRDLALGNRRSKEAILNTTFVRPEQLEGGRRVFPSPEPIALKHVLGTTLLKTIAGQVYALTLANYNSYRRTNRLPITTAYADALVNNARLKEDQSALGKPIDGKTVLYWL